MRVRFGECVFDDQVREVTRAGTDVALTPKAFELLALLLERRPAAVPKRDLQDRLWPSTFVAATSLARVVTELRQAIGDDRKQPRFIRTVHGFGYAFRGEALDSGDCEEHATAPCGLLWRDREVPLAEGDNLIGRGQECAVRIRSPRVSRQHARIAVAEGTTTMDLGSKNGTAVGGRRIAGTVPLRAGDEILIGPEVLIYVESLRDSSTETATRRRSLR